MRMFVVGICSCAPSAAVESGTSDHPQVTLKVTTNKSAVYAVAFNPRWPELLASADAQGYVKVWRLSQSLATMAPREIELLSQLATSASRATTSAEEEALQAEPGHEEYAFDDDEAE